MVHFENKTILKNDPQKTDPKTKMAIFAKNDKNH